MEIKKANLVKSLLFITAISASSCKNEYPELRQITYPSEEIKLYSQTIDEFVINRLYYFSFKEEFDELEKKWMDKEISNEDYQKSAEKIRKKFIDHPENICFIYIDSSRLPGFGYERKGLMQKINFPDSVFNLFGEIDTALMISQFNSVNKIRAESLLSNYITFIDNTSKSNSCFVGRITFSQPYFNLDKTSVIFHCNYVCGSPCGYGGFIALKKYNGNWKEIGFDKNGVY